MSGGASASGSSGLCTNARRHVCALPSEFLVHVRRSF